MSLTVDKALGILELLGDGELRLTDLSSKPGERKSTAPAVMAAARQISDNLGSEREEGREEPA